MSFDLHVRVSRQLTCWYACLVFAMMGIGYLSADELCPSAFVMQFGGYYYYDCHPPTECPTNQSHLLAGDTNTHALGCMPSMMKCKESITRIKNKDYKERKTEKPKTKKKVTDKPNDPKNDSYSYVLVAASDPNLGSVKISESLAKYQSKWFRVVKVEWGNTLQFKGVIAYECTSPSGSPEFGELEDVGDTVRFKVPFGVFGKDDVHYVIIEE